MSGLAACACGCTDGSCRRCGHELAVENVKLKRQNDDLKDALEALVKMYVMNRNSEYEFITCITPPNASDLTPDQRRESKTWRAWDRARALLTEETLMLDDEMRSHLDVIMDEYSEALQAMADDD